MPIPDNYREVCEMLLEATNAGRVNWQEQGASVVVRLPDYSVEIWSGTDEMEFVALGLKEPTGRVYFDNWYVEEGDKDFQGLKSLYDAARRHAKRVPQRLEELVKLLQSGEKVGKDGSSESWKAAGNWEIRGTESANWKLGPDWLRGDDSGHVLWKEPLPSACRIEFEARITANKGSDEIDVIVGDVMILYYAAGVRLDWMTEDLMRERNKRMVGRPGPQLNKWYRYSLEVTAKNKCTASIDGERIVEFDCNLGRTWFTGRFGFAHWRDTLEIRNLRIEATKA